MKITKNSKVTASSNPWEGIDPRDWYFGKPEADKYGDMICEKLAGQTVSKRKDLAEEPGGLIYEANKLGLDDFFDLLRALEGLCYQGRAREIDDSTYKILGSTSINAGTDYKRIAYTEEYDNPHLLRGDWSRMSDDEAEDLAKQTSIDDPHHIYYVQYDDVMNPSSDIRWIAGEAYDASTPYSELRSIARDYSNDDYLDSEEYI